VKRSRPPRRSSWLPRGTPVKRRNAKRQAREFARAYGSPERCDFVAALPCSVRGCPLIPSENAHVVRLNGGAGRKSDAAAIAPLCLTHHRELHRVGPATFARTYGLSLDALAAETARAWEELPAA
jgi:hypothetical protein